MRFRCLAFLLTIAALLMAPVEAHAKRRVEWTQIDVRKGDDAKRVSKRFRSLLRRKTRRAKWGKGNSLKLNAKITQLDWEKRDDVLRVTVTVIARIEGSKRARSHIRVGGHPKNRRKLEKEALKIVADGLVTRLADIARSAE